VTLVPPVSTTWSTGNTATVTSPVITITGRVHFAGLGDAIRREMVTYARRNPGRGAA
jgi:hypothetical protein